MRFPKKIVKPVVISIAISFVISVILVLILGFETTQKILGFVISIIGLPIMLLNLYETALVLDESKIINRALIEAGKKSQEEWEKEKEMCSANVTNTNRAHNCFISKKNPKEE
jgi:hypothetical protein